MAVCQVADPWLPLAAVRLWNRTVNLMVLQVSCSLVATLDLQRQSISFRLFYNSCLNIHLVPL